MYNTIKISNIRAMTAENEQQIKICAIIDLEHLVESLDSSTFELLKALVGKRVSEVKLSEVKNQRALKHIESLKSQISK